MHEILGLGSISSALRNLPEDLSWICHVGNEMSNGIAGVCLHFAMERWSCERGTSDEREHVLLREHP